MSHEEILRRIPHRDEMLLIDRIVDEGDGTITTEKTFRAEESFFRGHFPNQPIVPGVIQCECCLQSGALLLAGGPDSEMANRLPVATRMDNVKFKKMVAPGDTVQIVVTLNETVSNAYYMTGKMTLNGKLCARLDFTCSLVESGQ